MIVQKNGELKITAEHIIDEAYTRGKNDAKREISLSGEYERAYHRGLDDAWEAAKKIALSAEDGGLSNETAYDIFGMRFYQVFRDMSVTEVIEKIKKYEHEKKEAKKCFCNFIQKRCPYEIECDECEVQCSYDRACKKADGVV